MSGNQENLLSDLSAQLEKAISSGFTSPIVLGSESDDARKLEKQLATLLNLARSGSIHDRNGDDTVIESQRKKLGWFLDSILENAPIMLFVKNGEDLKVELWNKRAEEISGVKKEDILGKTGFETFPAEQMEEFHRRDREVLVGKKLVEAEEQLTSPSGEAHWLSTKKIPLLDEQGSSCYLLGISEDITERKRATEALQKAKDEAESANRMKSELIANVSHELRTPLTLIAGTIEALLLGAAGELAPEVLERLHRIRRNSARLTSLVNDLLDLSKLEAGKTEVRWQPVNVSDLVADIADEAQAIASNRGISLQVRSSGDLGYVPLDRRMFEKIVLNLVSNALKFTSSGGQVHIHTGLSGEELELAVEDSGIGIPKDKLPLLFQRFQQLDSSASRKYEGTGIGLALVKELTELMGGRVSVESEEGRGARFTVRIPSHPDQRVFSQDGSSIEVATRGLEHMVPLAAQPAVVDFTGKPRLILAEDNEDMRAYVTELLSEEYDVVAVKNGREALESARSFLPDVIVTDVMMPEMNGFELVAQLKEDPDLRQVPVILLTARAGQEAIASGLEGGADDYLSKPFSPAELRARIAAARRLHKAYQDLALHAAELVATRDQLVAAEKLSLAGRLSRSVAEQLSEPLSRIQSQLATISDKQGTADALAASREAVSRVSTLISGLGRLAEPPSFNEPERLDVSQFIETIVGELPEGMSSRLLIHPLAGQVSLTDVAPSDLRVAISNVLSFLCRSDRDTRADSIDIEVRQERHGPCLTISNTGLRLSPEEREQALDPRVEPDEASGEGLRLDVGLAIARQVLQRNGADLSVEPLSPQGISFQISFTGVA